MEQQQQAVARRRVLRAPRHVQRASTERSTQPLITRIAFECFYKIVSTPFVGFSRLLLRVC